MALLLDLIGNYFATARRGIATDIESTLTLAQAALEENDDEIAELLRVAPELRDETAALLALAHSAEALATPIIAKTSATGTLLKRKLEPVVAPLLEQIAVLQEKK